MKDAPKTIYLNFGPQPPTSFQDAHQVAWCEDRIDDGDLEYRLVEKEPTLFWHIRGDIYLGQGRTNKITEYLERNGLTLSETPTDECLFTGGSPHPDKVWYVERERPTGK